MEVIALKNRAHLQALIRRQKSEAFRWRCAREDWRLIGTLIVRMFIEWRRRRKEYAQRRMENSIGVFGCVGNRFRLCGLGPGKSTRLDWVCQEKPRRIRSKEGGMSAWFKKGSGTVVHSTPGAVPATVPDPFLNHGMSARWVARE